MVFTRAYFSIEPTAKLGKKNIEALNDVIGTVFRMNKYNYKILLDLIAQDKGVEVLEPRHLSLGSKHPFDVVDIKHDGKLIGTIYLNFKVEEVAVSV